MKYVIVIPDGCADEPQGTLQNQTPLQYAELPNCDAVVQSGSIGRANHVPPHLPAGSAVANMSLLGYDPNDHFQGRAPLEAAALGITLGPNDWAIRCNLVTIKDQIMTDFTAGHISSDEARELLEFAQSKLEPESAFEFFSGVSYRNLVVYRGKNNPAPYTPETRTIAPHDLIDQPVTDQYPRGPGSDSLNELMRLSTDWFSDHRVNKKRIDQNQSAATNLWLWGLGQQPQFEPFSTRYGLNGTMITAVDLLKGLAKLIGWKCLMVPGATGYLDTNYAAKGAAAIEALKETDLVCIHIEATDEASHEGRVEEKVRAMEAIDREIIGPVWRDLQNCDEGRMLICPDHATPLRTRMHSHGHVPFAIAGTGVTRDPSTTYDEVTAMNSQLIYDSGWELMSFFIR